MLWLGWEMLALPSVLTAADLAWVVAASFLLWCTVTAATPPSLSVDSRSRITSSAHAVVTCTLAYWGLCEVKGPRTTWAAFAADAALGQPSENASLLWFAASPACNLACAVTAGYILADCALGWASPGLLDAATAVHHAIALIACTAAPCAAFGVPLVTVSLLNEVGGGKHCMPSR